MTILCLATKVLEDCVGPPVACLTFLTWGCSKLEAKNYFVVKWLRRETSLEANFKKLCFAAVAYYLFRWKLLKKFFIKWTGSKSKNIGISSANGFLMGMVKVPPPSSLKNRQLVRCPSVRTDRIWKPISISFLRTFKKCDWRFSAVRETIGMKQMRSSYRPETEEMKKDSKVLVGSSFSCPKKDPPIYSTLWVEYTWKWDKNI